MHSVPHMITVQEAELYQLISQSCQSSHKYNFYLYLEIQLNVVKVIKVESKLETSFYLHVLLVLQFG